MEIHSNKKGDIGEEEWNEIKQRLFDIDRHEKPKIIVSVLMLREGFDVNNICVIVPLRSSSSLDILSIVEHPAFIEFYDRVLEGNVGKVKELPSKDRIVGDIINVGLKPNYKNYDLFWPLIIHDREEEMGRIELSIDQLEQFPIKLHELKPLVKRTGDIFYGEEITVKTRFGEYSVTADIFTAKSYNSFIQKIVNAVSIVHVKSGTKRNVKSFPLIQINSALIAKLTDDYIRHKLFGEDFDPLDDNNWRVLLITQERIIQHIVTNIAKSVYSLQNNLKVNEATIIKRYFSEIPEIKIRETYALNVAKTIYDRIAYPSNSGGFRSYSSWIPIFHWY